MSRLLLGKIATAHGVRGLVKLLVLGEDPDRLESCGPAWTAQKGGIALKLRMKNPLGKYYLAEIEGVTSREEAEKLRHTELWFDRDKLPVPDDDEYYYADLMDLPVFDEKGRKLGMVIAVENFGASDLLEIKPPQEPSFYLPFTEETVITVEPDNKIVVSVPDGLLEP